MPRRTPKRTPPPKRRGSRLLGPYDLSTIGLLGGSEEQALGLGFALENGRAEGFAQTNVSANQTIKNLVERANQLVVQDSSNAYIVMQPDVHGPFARAINMSSLRTEFAAELSLGGLPDTLTEAAFKHQLDAKLNMTRGQSVFRGLPGDHNYRPTDATTGQQANIFIARTAQAKNLLPKMTPMRIRY